MPYPVFPHGLDHLIVRNPCENIEIISLLGEKYVLETFTMLRREIPNYCEFLDWVSEQENDIVPYQIQITMCTNIWLESCKGSTKTLRALFIVPNINDRIITRSSYSETEYYRSISHYLAELNNLIKSAYPDIVPLC